MNTLTTDTKHIVVSFSGGRSSAMMCDLLETDPRYRDVRKHYVFANTGRELPATLNFVRWWEKYLNLQFRGERINLIEAVVHEDERKASTYKIIDKYSDLDLEGAPFESVVKKYGLPSVWFPHCTRELKVNPIKAFIRDHLGLKKGEYVQAIGMRFDEPKRVIASPEFIYPLYDARITKSDVEAFFAHPDRACYGLGLEDFEGNCDFCFKKSWDKLEKMRDKYLSRLYWWDQLEDKYWEPGTNSYRGHQVAGDLFRYQTHRDKNLACACGHNEDSSFV